MSYFLLFQWHRYTNTLMAVFNNRVFLTLNDARGDSVSTRSRFNLTSCPPQAISLSRMTSDTSHGDQVKIEIGVETQVITDKGVNEIVSVWVQRRETILIIILSGSSRQQFRKRQWPCRMTGRRSAFFSSCRGWYLGAGHSIIYHFIDLGRSWL